MACTAVLRLREVWQVITLITPTGDRHEAFALCEKWIGRQSYIGQIQWVVVDDGHEPTETTLGQEVLRPEPVEGYSLCRNLVLGRSVAGAGFAFVTGKPRKLHG